MTAPAPSRPAGLPAPPLDADAIRRLLPHSWPFLLLDRVDAIEAPHTARGVKNVTVGEPYFAGHFPDRSVMPGVLVIESTAQLAGVLLALETAAAGRPAVGFLAAVNRFRFRRPVRPGDQLRLTVTRSAQLGDVADFAARVQVDGAPVADGRFSVALKP